MTYFFQTKNPPTQKIFSLSWHSKNPHHPLKFLKKDYCASAQIVAYGLTRQVFWNHIASYKKDWIILVFKWNSPVYVLLCGANLKEKVRILTQNYPLMLWTLPWTPLKEKPSTWQYKLKKYSVLCRNPSNVRALARKIFFSVVQEV